MGSILRQISTGHYVERAWEGSTIRQISTRHWKACRQTCAAHAQGPRLPVHQPGSSIRYLSTGHAVAAYAISGPQITCCAMCGTGIPYGAVRRSVPTAYGESSYGTGTAYGHSSYGTA
eukprot:5457-Rhodomonas_salina.7